VVEVHEMSDGKGRHENARHPRALPCPPARCRRAQARRLPRHADGPEAADEGRRYSTADAGVEGKDKKRSTVEVKASVKPLTTAAPGKMDHQHKH
jgi:hypothetical protein